MKIINENNTFIYFEKYTWQVALSKLVQPLVKAKIINDQFLIRLYELTEKYGPYYVLNENLALAYINEDSKIIKGTGITFGYFKTPICFSATHHISFVFILAAEKTEDHLKILNQIVNLFANKKFLQQLQRCEDIIKIVKLTDKYLKN